MEGAIVEYICNRYGIDKDVVIFPNRKRNTQAITLCRQRIWYILYENKYLLKQSYASIGKKYGGKDHATVRHACVNVIPNLLETDKHFAKDFTELVDELKFFNEYKMELKIKLFCDANKISKQELLDYLNKNK